MEAAATPGSGSEGLKWRAHLAPAILLLVALLVSFIVRIRLADAPLERDEGEHAYLAQMMLDGNAPWKLAYNLKLPGTDAIYAVCLLFGHTAVAIRMGLLVLNTLTVFLVALLGRKLFGIAAGLVAGASYALLSSSQNVVGTVFHSTHLVVLFSVIAALLLLEATLKPWRLFATGLVYGLTFLMKQPGAAFAVFGALYIVVRWRQTRTGIAQGLRAILPFVAGCSLPYALLCVALWRAGVFERFWFWTVTLAEAYAAQRSFSMALVFLRYALPKVLLPNLFLWVTAAVGLGLALYARGTRTSGLFTAGLLVFSFAAVSAGGNFNPNYFIMMFPALALSVGALPALGKSLVEPASSATVICSPPTRDKTLRKNRKKRKNPNRLERASVPPKNSFFASRYAPKLPFLCCAIACFYSLAAQEAYLFSMTPYEFSRSSYATNPFPEAAQAGEYIRTHSDPGARVAVLGSEAEVYFYAQRRAATGYLFTYSLMETHRYAPGLQREMIAEIEAARPEYIVYVSTPFSWLATPQSPMTFYKWMPEYVSSHYDAVGIIELTVAGSVKYVWGSAAAIYQPASNNYLVISRRK